MDITALKRGQLLQDQIREYDSILSYFSRKDASDEPVKMLTEFLTGCQNISNATFKKTLAKVCIAHINEHLKAVKKADESEFDAL